MDVLCIITVHGTLHHKCNSSLTGLIFYEVKKLNRDFTVPIHIFTVRHIEMSPSMCVCMHACHAYQMDMFVSLCLCMLFACMQIQHRGSYTNIHTHTSVCMCVYVCVAFVNVSGQKPKPPLAPQGFTNSQRSQTQSTPTLSWLHLQSPSLCFCHALKPLEGLLPAINVTILSHKINEPAVMSQIR